MSLRPPTYMKYYTVSLRPPDLPTEAATGGGVAQACLILTVHYLLRAAQARPQLNDKVGTVLGWVADKERFNINLSSGEVAVFLLLTTDRLLLLLTAHR